MVISHINYDSNENNHHLILLYENIKIRDAIIINYINEGLNKNELCIYGTVSFRDKILSKISSEIIEYEKNISKDNLIVIDMSPFYIKALINDLRLFKQMNKSINEKIKNTKKNTYDLYMTVLIFCFRIDTLINVFY